VHGGRLSIRRWTARGNLSSNKRPFPAHVPCLSAPKEAGPCPSISPLFRLAQSAPQPHRRIADVRCQPDGSSHRLASGTWCGSPFLRGVRRRGHRGGGQGASRLPRPLLGCQRGGARACSTGRRIAAPARRHQIRHARPQASCQRPWEAASLTPGEDAWPGVAPSAVPFTPGEAAARRSTQGPLRGSPRLLSAAERAIRLG
jgi:hypothetical protein